MINFFFFSPFLFWFFVVVSGQEHATNNRMAKELLCCMWSFVFDLLGFVAFATVADCVWERICCWLPLTATVWSSHHSLQSFHMSTIRQRQNLNFSHTVCVCLFLAGKNEQKKFSNRTNDFSLHLFHLLSLSRLCDVKLCAVCQKHWRLTLIFNRILTLYESIDTNWSNSLVFRKNCKQISMSEFSFFSFVFLFRLFLVHSIVLSIQFPFSFVFFLSVVHSLCTRLMS